MTLPSGSTKYFEAADVFYNTYWVRFPHGDLTFEQAVENSKILINAAQKAGVPRIVNLGITNAGINSPYAYFRGKALVDQEAIKSGMSYALIKPTVIFGAEDVLVNNIAWLLRRFPVFAVPGAGDYKLQPVFVDDLAQIAVEAGTGSQNKIIDAVGPDIFTFEDLVRLIAEKIGRRVAVIHTPPELFLSLTKVMNALLRDVLLTREEVYGLMANLLISSQKPTGKTRLGDWLAKNSAIVGKKYANELRRHYV